MGLQLFQTEICGVTGVSDRNLWGYSQFRQNYVGLKSDQTELCWVTVILDRILRGNSGLDTIL